MGSDRNKDVVGMTVWAPLKKSGLARVEDSYPETGEKHTVFRFVAIQITTALSRRVYFISYL